MGCVLTARRAGGLALGLLAAVCSLTLLLPPLFGYSRYVITGGSMSGTFDRGSILYAEEVPVADLEVGDVITYVPPNQSALVTHRIIERGKSRAGARVFRTQGDANEDADPWTFKLDGESQARASFAIPYVGYLIAGLALREVRMAVVGLPALLIAFVLGAGLWRESGHGPLLPWPLGR